MLAALLIMSSCANRKSIAPPPERIEYVKITEVLRDTIFYTLKDSSKAVFQLKTDAQGKITPIRESVMPGRKLAVPKVSIDGQNKLQISCEAQAEELFLQWKETYRDSVSKTVIHNPPLLIEKELSSWEKTLLFLGYLFIAAVLIGCYLLYKHYWPKQ